MVVKSKGDGQGLGRSGAEDEGAVGEIKAQSTKWIRSEFPALTGFSWQAGYGLFFRGGVAAQ